MIFSFCALKWPIPRKVQQDQDEACRPIPEQKQLYHKSEPIGEGDSRRLQIAHGRRIVRSDRIGQAIPKLKS